MEEAWGGEHGVWLLDMSMTVKTACFLIRRGREIFVGLSLYDFSQSIALLEYVHDVSFGLEIQSLLHQLAIVMVRRVFHTDCPPMLSPKSEHNFA